MKEAFDALFASLYARAVDGDLTLDDALTTIAQHLERELGVVMAAFSERRDNGAIVMRATSREGALWLELQRLPQRSEGTVTAQGPAARALREQGPVSVPVSDPDFAPWQRVAIAEGVSTVHALPFTAPHAAMALELFARGEAVPPLDGSGALPRLLWRLERFLARLTQLHEQQLVTRAMAAAGNPALITDRSGTIVWVNRALCERTGYTSQALLGSDPRILQSGEHGLRYYRELWSTIRSGEVWRSETIDRDRFGEPYVIHQTVSPVITDGRVSHYLSVHVEMARERERRIALERTARIDARTGLMTRTAFEEAVDERCDAMPAAEHAALLVLSLRNLAKALDAASEGTRAQVSRILAARVRHALPGGAIAAEAGGGDYLVFVAGFSSGDVSALQQKLQQALATPLPEVHALPVPEIRMALATRPDQGDGFGQLLRVAERCLANEPLRLLSRIKPGASGRE